MDAGCGTRERWKKEEGKEVEICSLQRKSTSYTYMTLEVIFCIRFMINVSFFIRPVFIIFIIFHEMNKPLDMETPWLRSITQLSVSVALSCLQLLFHALLLLLLIRLPLLSSSVFLHKTRELKRVFTPLQIQKSSVRWRLCWLNVVAERFLSGHLS